MFGMIYYGIGAVLVLAVFITAMVRFFGPVTWEDGEDPEPQNIWQALWLWWRRSWWYNHWW